MDKYTIYCTEEQTKKAFELGAPIKKVLHPTTWFNEVYPKRCHIDILEYPNGCTLAIPTAEQMICWLEDILEFTTCHVTFYPVYELYGFLIIHKEGVIEHDASEGGMYLYNSRKEATLAAIDAALEYLIKAKEN